jgi:nitrite reductase/ring-hydroxylating ferredoxin subunit
MLLEILEIRLFLLLLEILEIRLFLLLLEILEILLFLLLLEIHGAVQVASLAALPEGGEPRQFPVLATRVDAWNITRNVPVGAVFLQRLKGGAVRAFNASCPHAGCFVGFRADKNCYLCPCHNSTFATDGQVLDRTSPSPRALDELTAEVRNGGEVWVAFRNFRPGEKERIPV